MSVIKRFLISVAVAMLIVLAGLFMMSVDGARKHLETQLQIQSSNVATTLAIALSQPSNQLPASQEALLAAIFDSGEFRRITLTDPDSKVVFERTAQPTTNADVPPWFVNWLPLHTPTATRGISNGQGAIGELSIVIDDRYASEAFWRNSVRMFVRVVAAGFLWTIFALFLSRRLKTDLRRETATAQANAMPEEPGETGVSSAGERMKELAAARNVIESVRERVRATSEEQNRQIESLPIEQNADPTTGAANRKYFINELRRELIEPRTPVNGNSVLGHVLIFRQRDLAAINALHNRSAADEWLHNVGQTVIRLLKEQAASDHPVPQLARLNGSDFVVLLAGYDGPDATDLIQALRRALDALRIRTSDDRLCRWSYALTDYGPGCDVGKVLARLDHGLMRAENAGHDEVEYLAANDYRAQTFTGQAGEMAWKALIQDALKEGRLELSVNAAEYRDDDITGRHEALLILRDAEEPTTTVSGYLFMPPAVRLGISGDCDLRAIELGLQWVRNNPGYLALRVSLASLLQPGFLTGLEQLWANSGASPEETARLAVEIDAHGFVAYPDEMETFCRILHRAGGHVGVRRLAEQPAALLRLHKVSIRYIKLGGDLISGLLESPGATQLIAAITEAAIGQGVKIYAHDVPNAATAALLLEYGVLLPEGEDFEPLEEDSEGGFVDN